MFFEIMDRYIVYVRRIVREYFIFLLEFMWSLKVMGIKKVINVIGNIVFNMWNNGCLCMFIWKIILVKGFFFIILLIGFLFFIESNFYFLFLV